MFIIKSVVNLILLLTSLVGGKLIIRLLSQYVDSSSTYVWLIASIILFFVLNLIFELIVFKYSRLK